jgi:hypothetical protein
LLGCNFGPGKVSLVFVYTTLQVLLSLLGFTFGSSQVGADVPAESFEVSSVDRIFVRMGAKDHIMAGQSTFLTELSETALMLVRFLSRSKDFHYRILLFAVQVYRLCAES